MVSAILVIGPLVANLLLNNSCHHFVCLPLFLDWSLVVNLLTLFVFIFQAWIFFRQSNISLAQGKILSRQTDIAEQAMTISMQPRLYFKSIEVVIHPQPGDRYPIPHCQFEIRSVGDTPATVIRLAGEFSFVRHDGHIVRRQHSLYRQTRTLLNGESQTIVESLNFDDHERQQILGDFYGSSQINKYGDQYHYICIGKVIYEDVFGNQHELSARRRVERGGGAGVLDGGSINNYHKLLASGNRFWYDGRNERWDGP